MLSELPGKSRLSPLILLTIVVLADPGSLAGPGSSLANLSAAHAQDADDDDDDGNAGDDDDGGSDTGGGGGGVGGAGGGNDPVNDDDGDNSGPSDSDDCFEEAVLLPPWLRRCNRPSPTPKQVEATSGGTIPSDDAPADVALVRPGAPAISDEPANALPREIVIARATQADIDQLVARGFTIISRTAGPVPGGDMVRFRVPGDLSTADARALARQIAAGAIVDFNHIYRPAQETCTSIACRQRTAIRWPNASIGCDAQAQIGLVDTTIDVSHPALLGQSVDVIDGVTDNRAQASSSHGTAIAALMVGRADASVPGLLPNAKAVIVQAFHRNDKGEDIADTFDIVSGVDQIVRRGIGVVNLSFTGPHNRVLAEVVRLSISKGAALIAAAGNLGPTGPVVYPAGYESVIAVTAVGADLRVYRGAVRGSHIDFSAPGVGVQVVAAREATRFESGTSFAAPFVSAALAAMRSRQPTTAVGDLVSNLQATASDLGRPGRDPVFGWGIVQVPKDICQ